MRMLPMKTLPFLHHRRVPGVHPQVGSLLKMRCSHCHRPMRLPKEMQKISFDSLNPREAEMLIMYPFLLIGQNLRQSRTREVFLLPPSGDEVPGRWLQLVQQVWGQARAW